MLRPSFVAPLAGCLLALACAQAFAAPSPYSTMVVFGDSLNDMSMLAFTKNSVAMGNARDEVKQSTQFVCGPNTKDGLAHFIQEHILSERSNVYDQH
ncbi:MAG: HAD hydrolase family protein [Clostridia bacterium]